MSHVIVRFAPSPTGNLHIGNIRTALINFLFAKKNNGKFILRIDDTDTERSRKKYENNIKDDLKWLGLGWDLERKQSDRIERYNDILKHLIEIGRVYECFETQDELDLKRKSQLMSGKPPVYDRSSLKLTKKEKSIFISEGRKPHYRFLLNHDYVEWNDNIKGIVKYHMSNVSDPVILREDGRYIYTLASVVDDIDYGISHIIRGEDHVTNSAAQLQIFKSLRSKLPEMCHLALISGFDGQGLSKRLGSFSLNDLRKEQILPIAILSYLSTIGTSESINLKENIEEIISNFKFSKFGNSTSKFDFSELNNINIKALQKSKLYEVKDYLNYLEIKNIDEKFWEIIRKNINVLSDTKMWVTICFDEIKPIIKNKIIIKKAIDCFPSDEFDTSIWNDWVSNILTGSDFKKNEVFMSLRLAITGKEKGPDLSDILSFIPKEVVLKRLQGNTV